MSDILTQLEEIDLVLKETDKRAMKADIQVTNEKPLTKVTQEGWSARYISPYRAAYIKAHGFDS